MNQTESCLKFQLFSDIHLEFYSSNKTHQKLKQSYKDFFSFYSNIHLLDDSYYNLEDETNNYLIYGSTLWSQINSSDGLNDFSMIKMKNDKNWSIPIDITYYNNLHIESTIKLFNMIKTQAVSSPKNIIIMTHFPPLRKTNKQNNFTSHPMYQNQHDSIKKYFSNDFTEEFLNQWGLTESELYSNIKVWISGHTHYSYDFNYKTRFLSNQIGYQSEIKDTGFDIDGVFELKF
jgi:hypothetical protein